MAQIQVPIGFVAVAVLIPRGDDGNPREGGESEVKIVGITSNDVEHAYVADAINALVDEQVAAIDELVDLLPDPDAEPGEQEPEGEDDEEDEEEKEPEPS